MNTEATYWRPAYEVYAVAGWGGAAAISFWVMTTNVLPAGPFWYAIAFSLFRLSQRLWSAIGVWRHRGSLNGKAIEWMSTAQLVKKMNAKPGHVWLGWGFGWTREHMQRLYELEKENVSDVLLPKLVAGGPKPQKGSPYVHGVETAEKDVYVSLDEIAGHMFVPAATGAIKTRLLSLLAIQAIHRQPRESVVIIDPKGDNELRDLIQQECIRAGRADDFAYFHPAFPEESIRLDPLRNWKRATEVASRIGALVPSESGNDPFSAFGWRVCHLVAEGCIETLGNRPTLTSIRRYVEGGVDSLLHNTIVALLDKEGIDWRTASEPYMKQIKRQKRPSPTTPDETVALVAYYKAERQENAGVGLIDGLISMFEHDREHAQKMLASLIPTLTMLTAEDLADLLSPDRSDPSDARPIIDGAKIVESGTVLYMGLDALSDSVIAGAIASIALADMAAHAGARYNEGIKEPLVNVFVDEANEAVNVPFIQLLNKGRSAGFRVVFFSQTVPDFVAKLGNEALARQVLGNANTVLTGRVKEGKTGEYVVETFGKTILKHMRTTQGTTPVPNGEIIGFGSSYGEQMNEMLSEIVPPDQLGRLPDLEYFASFSGGAIFKGRIPLLKSEQAA